MRMILLVVFAMIPGLMHSRSLPACKELQPSLHDYRVAEHGKSYLEGRLAFASLSASEEVCEKLRQDATVYRCRFKQARSAAESSFRLGRNQLAQVRRRMNIDPRGIAGGEAANRRVIRESAGVARRARAELAASLLEMKQTRIPYRAVVQALERKGCWHSYKGRRDEDPVLGKHPLLDVVSRGAGRDAPESWGDALERILDALKSAGVIE